MNSVNLTARLTRDPDMVEVDPKRAVCNLRVAVERRGEGAVCVDVRTFGPQATACADYLSKGDPVALSGRLELAERSRLGGDGKRSEDRGREGSPESVQASHLAPNI